MAARWDALQADDVVDALTPEHRTPTLPPSP